MTSAAPSPILPGPSLPELTLRGLTWPDIPVLTALESELFADDAWSERTWWAELAGRPRRSYVLAERGGEVVGYAGVDCGNDVADVMTLAVARSAQGRGIGKLLMRWLIAAARHSGAGQLMLEVRADNAAAQRLYTTMGFATLTVRRRYYQPGDVDALIMRLHLGDEVDDAGEDLVDEPAAEPSG